MVLLKKKYFDVKIEIFNTLIPLLSFKKEELINKTITFDLTRILRGKSCEAKFLVKEKNDELIGEIYAIRMPSFYVTRLIGRGSSIVEDSFVLKIKDASLRIKPFLITRRKVHRSVRKALRNKAREFIKKTIENKARTEVFQDIIASNLQKMLSKKLKKVYPIAVCEIRAVKVEKSKK